MASPPDRASVVTAAILADITDAFRDWLHHGVPLTSLRSRIKNRLRDEFADAVRQALNDIRMEVPDDIQMEVPDDIQVEVPDA